MNIYRGQIAKILHLVNDNSKNYQKYLNDNININNKDNNNLNMSIDVNGL